MFAGSRWASAVPARLCHERATMSDRQQRDGERHGDDQSDLPRTVADDMKRGVADDETEPDPSSVSAVRRAR